MNMPFTITSIAPWVLRIIAALIMLQTLYFKFSGAEESVYIFSQLGMEPWGRIGTGIFELIASILILYPETTFLGSVLAIGLMLGAIGAHFIKLGIVVKNDGGQLFIYALLVLISSIILAVIYRNDGMKFIKRIIKYV
jgi:uncharacterized membrane protein YphA (DoxX/SURF4 family)